MKIYSRQSKISLHPQLKREMLLLLDNFDSFTYNLVDYFQRLNVRVKVVRNNIDPDTIDKTEISGLVISPGPGTPEKAGHLLKYLEVFTGQIPILGICLGHQAIGEYFGAELVKAKRPMHGKTSIINIKQDPLFYHLPSSWKVVRYHSLILTNLPETLLPIAESDGEIMAIRHSNKAIYGIQFHPEAALSENGLELLRNWVLLNKLEQVELM